MIFAILFLLTLSSGSLFSTAYFKTRYEDVLPISALGWIFVVYIFGLFNHLYLGVIFCTSLCIVLYLGFFYSLFLNRKNIKKHITMIRKKTFTTAFFIYWIISWVLLIVLNGLQASSPDEFSHWMYIVKIMDMFDMFGTNACVNAWNSYPSYVPGMAIFQYSVEKYYHWVNGGSVFCEWVVYWAYYLLFISCSLPLLKRQKSKGVGCDELLNKVLKVIIILFVPVLYFEDLYHSIYIDPFLGILAGVTSSLIITKDRKDKNWYYSVYVWLAIVSLVLAKDVGVIFGAFIAVLFVFDYLSNGGVKREKEALLLIQ